MSIHETSLGPLYFALPEVNKRIFRPTVGDVTEMCAPWRRGKVLVLCTGFKTALAFGLWASDINDDIVKDFANPAWMKLLGDDASDISKWSSGAETAQDRNGEPE